MNNNGIRLGTILGAVIVFCSLFYVFRKSTMIHALTNIKTSSEVIAIFPNSVSQIKSNTQKFIEESKNELEKILAIPDAKRNFENTALAFDRLQAFSNLAVYAGLLQTVDLIQPDEKLRAAARDGIIAITNYLIEVSSDKHLYKAFKYYVENNLKNENLTEEQQYFVDETMRDFERSGLNLPDEKLEEVKRLRKEIAQLEIDFEKNIAEDQRKVVVNQEDLEGLSESFINSLPKDEEGNYMLGTDTPTYVQVMENATNPTTRKNLWNAYMNRAFPINKELLEKLIAKRHELARLLGFNTYADLELDSQMVGSPERAAKFLSGIELRAKKKAETELKKLMEKLPDAIKLTQNGKIYPWDMMYLKNYYKKNALNVDENKVAEYFPMQHTIDSLLNIYQEFFGLEFKQLPAQGLWDPEVKLIEVVDKISSKTIGFLFLDLFPRPGKFTHACENTIVPVTYLEDGNPNLGVVIVVANFPKSTADKPSLLKYRDVTTFFHEFGHAIHALFGRTELASQAGTHVKRDFVEMPSQMLEEWMRVPQILKIVSSHYQTGEQMPDDLIQALLKMTTYDSGLVVSRQLLLANLSLKAFNNGPDVNINDLYHTLLAKFIIGIQHSPDDHLYAAFGHITNYGARYYGYMWSEVFAHDLFGEIKKAGLLDPIVGRRYVDKVIGRGGSKDPNYLLKDFLGREPNQEAFFRNRGF